MTNSRFGPRRLLVLAGIAAAALAVWRDRDLLHARGLWSGMDGLVDIPDPLPDLPVQRLRAALQAHQDVAGQSLQAGLDAWTERADSGEVTGPEHPAWAPYWEARARVFPAYAASLEGVRDAALAAGQDEPDNGLFDVVAGLIDVSLACSPGAGEPLHSFQPDIERSASFIRVIDPARLERGLAHIDAGLARPHFTSHAREVVQARVASVPEGLPPLERCQRRLSAGFTVLMPELLFIKQHVVFLSDLARSVRQAGLPAEALLARARRIGLRHGAEATFIIELLVGKAEHGIALDAWLADAAARGDVARARAVSEENLESVRRRFEARQLRDVSMDRLGSIDRYVMPIGGWKAGTFDEDLGRRVDHALLESALLHGLLLLALVGLVASWWRARGVVPQGAPRPAGFTLGDVLGVVLPGFGAAAVVALVHTRLHPVHGASVGSPGMAEVTLAQSLTLLALAALTHRVLLRRASLEKHGLALRRPALALGGLKVALAGGALALLCVSGRDQALLPLGVVLVATGAVIAWRGGALGKASADAAEATAVRVHEGRVGMASLGVAMALLAAAECALVAPRRDGLVRDLEAQYLRLMEVEASSWGGGQPIQQLQALLAEQPDGPALPQ